MARRKLEQIKKESPEDGLAGMLEGFIEEVEKAD